MPNVIDIRTGKVIKEFGYTEDDRDAAEAFASRSEHYRVGDKSLTKFPPIEGRHGLEMKREDNPYTRKKDSAQRERAGTNITRGASFDERQLSERLGQPRERSMYTQSDPSRPYPGHVQRDIAPDVPGGNPIAGMVNPNPITSVDPAIAQRAMQMGALTQAEMGGPTGQLDPTNPMSSLSPAKVGSPFLHTQQGPIRRDLKPAGRSGTLRRPAPTMEEIQRRLSQLQQQRGGPLGPPR
tara:strand:- start:95 stop:808 length:714 start_codon:yes stop_codon:yes gene_type:complete